MQRKSRCSASKLHYMKSFANTNGKDYSKLLTLSARFVNKEWTVYGKGNSSHLSNRLKEHYPALKQYVSHWRSVSIFYTPVLTFLEEFWHFTGLRPVAANDSKLSQLPYTQNNNKTILLTNFLKSLTWKKDGLVAGQNTSFSSRDLSRKVCFIYTMSHSARLHIPFAFCYALSSFSSESPFMNNLNELFEACNPK